MRVHGSFFIFLVPRSAKRREYKQRGDKNRRSVAHTIIAPVWGKMHIPGNLPLPASSLLTPASLLLIPDWLWSHSGLDGSHKIKL